MENKGITMGVVPLFFKLLGKIDLTNTINKIKEYNDFVATPDKENAEAQLVEAFKTELGFDIMVDLAPQLPKVADDLIPIVAKYKGVSEEEAEKIDLADLIDDIRNDKAIQSFFSRALRHKVEQEL